jgi:hypothetical protein
MCEMRKRAGGNPGPFVYQPAKIAAAAPYLFIARRRNSVRVRMSSRITPVR